MHSLRTARRRRRYLTFCLFLSVLILTCYLNRNNKAAFDDEDLVNEDELLDMNKKNFLQHSGRHLLSIGKETSQQHEYNQQHHSTNSHENANKTAKHDVKCARPDIEQFPKGFINQKSRRHGAVIIHFLIATYMFIALAIVCDEYFVPSLNDICKKFELKEDVAGATFMAAGSSAPELATTLISLFVAKDVDIGIGAVVGSAVFNIMFIISLVALLSGMIISLNWFPLIRDSFFYLIAILAMIFVIMDERVYWYEAVFLLMLYVLYIFAMLNNNKIESWALAHIKFMGRSDKLDFVNIEGDNYKTLENEPISGRTANLGENNMPHAISSASIVIETQSNSEKTLLEDNSEPSNISPFVFPKADQPLKEKIRYFICWPIFLVLYFTVPNSRKTEWHKFYLLTFFMSLVWLSLFSYIMVWMITIIGYTFLIPDTVMGITLIAFGASVPDALSSILVAKNGHGDMAVSNAIGSNVFDILICLGVPWFVRTVTMNETYIIVKSKGLKYSTITLFATVIILIVSIRLNKWQLDKKLGIFLMFIYLLFIMLTSLYELNILGSNHLPMCENSEW